MMWQNLTRTFGFRMKPVFFPGLLLLILACQQAGPQQEASPSMPEAETPQLQPMAAPSLSDTIPKAYLLGKFDHATHPDFVALKPPYAGGSALNQFLRKEAYESFIAMADAAREEGLALTILSAGRDFVTQKGIWEAKWDGSRLVNGGKLPETVPDPVERAKTILQYSSMPGTSRHHWGTDMDLNSFENDYFSSGEGKKVYDWLLAHAAEYGFCQPYTDKTAYGRTGYEEERWHWSFMPLAAPLLKAYQEKVTLTDIEGFKGAASAAPLSVIQNYVAGIHIPCLQWEINNK